MPPAAPIFFKIPSFSSSGRLPSNIPLRALSSPGTASSSASSASRAHADRQSGASLLASSAAARSGAASSSSSSHPRPSSSRQHRKHESLSSAGDYSENDYSSDPEDDESWLDTADIAEQLAEDGDNAPAVRARIYDNLDQDTLAGVLKQNHPTAAGNKARQNKKRVHYDDGSDSDSSPRRSHHAHRPHHHHSGAVNKEAIHIPETAVRRVSAVERILASIMSGGSSSIHGLTGKPLIYFTSIFVSLGVFLFGYDQGVMSDYFDNPSRAEVGTMVAILEIGAFISSLVVGRVGDIIGRRKTILYGSIIFFTGGALQTLATSMAMMMLGRIIAGLGVGMLSTIVPVYQSEISPPHNRGKLACIEFSGNIIGYTTSVWVDYFCGFIDSNMSWRIPLMMQCIMGALLGLGSLIIVESPRWLLDNDLDEEGIVVIANLYGGGDIHNPKARDEFREIKMDVLIQRQEGERTYAEMFRRYKKRVLIAMSAQALAQLNGINVISYYAPYVFESAGWAGHSAVLMTGINGITYFLSTIPPWYIVDRWGRRVILLTGAVAMCISLSFISYFIFLDLPTTRIYVVAFVMIYNAAFGYSWGPIPWLYPPEILPLSIRSKGASLSTATNWAFNWLVGEMTPILQEWIAWRLYLVHAFFCALSFVVVYFFYPETCGVRLEEMDSLFGDASTTMGTPRSIGTPLPGDSESGALLAPGSPVPSLDLRASRGQFGPSSAIPGLNIDPPSSLHEAGLSSSGRRGGGAGGSEGSSSRGGVSGWLSRVGVFRGGSPSNTGENGGKYAPLGQGDE
ncbi:Ribulose bisphosphate carboxylase large chain [Sporothrix stenoceras]|uniref:Ribulose bisphosphate carboxylase large chain n=1 Tax=Sporothrix stenoceras TaxID=5173 RepID=A0ABR3ZLY2_9PEZI